MATPLLEGFPPVVDDGARLLILGSFPSVQSLAARQYYGNPRNAFWPITSALFGFDAHAPYETRLAALQSHGVALWDVLHKCRRAGSSDAKIDLKSMVANDFGHLFAAYRSIETVYFNGHTAEKLFRRLVRLDAPVSYQPLPSTSPARAMPPGQKLDAWRVISPS
jgi:hypoxanthine-DNA glycosylase